jgi:hypothetical protein
MEVGGAAEFAAKSADAEALETAAEDMKRAGRE